ncbi:MAG: beta-lactamase family protein [Bacteroidia bacterium]|nr:beta-lactamase family protein [Bacteroidia bacterium]
MKTKTIKALALIALTTSFSSCNSQDIKQTEATKPTDPSGITNAEVPLFTNVDKMLTRLESQGFNGAVIVADENGFLSKGYGWADKEAKIKNTPNTAFCIGSITKSFTGAALLKLEMQGKLSVNDLLSKYIKNVPTDKKDITLHHLLTHSSGLPPAIGQDYEVLGKEDFLVRAFKIKLLFAPGTKYEYSNVGYSVLAAVIEQVSGQSYEEYLNANLFKPAEMTQTGYTMPKWDSKNIAVGYEGNSRWGKPNEQKWDAKAPYWNLLGNGGILSTAEDMYKWHKALLTDKVLNEDAKAKYYGRHVEEGEGAGSYYGYGVVSFPTPRKTWLTAHNGSNGIFYAAFMRYITEKVTIIFLTNQLLDGIREVPQEIALHKFKEGYVSEHNITAPKQLSGLTDHAHNKLILEFINVVSDGNDKAIEKFVDANLTPELKNAAPMNAHIGMFKQVGGDIKGKKIKSVMVAGSKTKIGFEGTPILLNLHIENGLIGGIGLGD